MAMASAYSSPLPQTPFPRFDSLLTFPNFSSSHKARCFLRFHGKNRYLTATRPALFPVQRPYLSICPSDPLRIRFPLVSTSLSGGEGGGDRGSSSGEAAGKPVAGDSEDATALGSDVIALRVGGMICGGCAASVKRILETLPQVHSATVNLEQQTAFIWAAPEAKVKEDWQQELGEQLAKHLTTCGFESNLQDLSSSNLAA
ncbi:copper-transporting ATPase PAA1, chloroplastic-like isoform X1 [Zingiber officinale]|uniref:copper-transporting ATPase PAA1, chloroplastic-like isoform X1 n=1 Tax=Zingiber officinale TaxID=94328 RepID=UPI001C4B6E82|nr:copper-transporting ATPase PAA1, chloroplastic-like isoform X1 [Zingiber officinale]XP_042463610.1 copper-transporting ATPase PAA1, chloroplastic-like isoform X1 [Zingiber officinale]XP_042463612.1 copper-transporting ATPase PAA1, chloroplastic-like isoform X1 [Zingiber officinale]